MIGRLSDIRQRRETLVDRSTAARMNMARHFAECEAAMGPVDAVYRSVLFMRANPVLTAGIFALVTRLVGGLFWRRKRRKKERAAEEEEENGQHRAAAKIPLWIGRTITGVQIARQILSGLQRIR